MDVVCLDMETDGLLDTITKVHVMGTDTEATTDYQRMRELWQADTIKVCHNIAMFDAQACRRILGVEPGGVLIDTLAVSWYINYDRGEHGLDSYGDEFGIKKPEVSDWTGEAIEVYIHRVQEDVKIQRALWNYLYRKLKQLYGTDEEVLRICKYLTFKMDCLAEQEQLRWRLDLPYTKELFHKLQALKDQKVDELKTVMPFVPKYKTITKPKVWFKKDGSLSSHALRYIEKGGDENTDELTLLDRMEEPNPNSDDQIKAWLFSLGWEPETYKFVKNKETGEERQIPQVKNKGELCQSVERLVEDKPELAVLSDLSVISHRLGVVKGFLEKHVDGWVVARSHGFTNTLRLRHTTPCVNLPGVSAPWGREIRSCLVAPEGMELCGADMVSLESTTRNHYIQPLDPVYVEEMGQLGYDPHLKIAVMAGMITEDEYEFYVWYSQKEG